MHTRFVIFNSFHSLLIPQQPCVPTFFGNYSSSFQVAANQSAIADLEKNDLQVGMGTADNTGSKVEFNSMVHSMGLAHLMFSPSNVVMARLLKSDGTILRDVGKTNIYACETFNPTSYKIANSSNSKNEECHNYLYIGNPYVGLTFSPDASSTFTWNINSVSLVSNVVKDVEITCTKLYKYRSSSMNAYSYTGNIQTFSATANKVYLFEVWGAKGGSGINSEDGNYGGKGGYSYGLYTTNAPTNLYVVVGQTGTASFSFTGGYNGGGSSLTNVEKSAGGGGATHIALKSGVLSSLINTPNSVLIVAGGGGGGPDLCTGGYGGGLVGGDGLKFNSNDVVAKGGSQSSGGAAGLSSEGSKAATGSFGAGGNGWVDYSQNPGGAGGGGWYGGGGIGYAGSGGGGSGHIGPNVIGETIGGNKTIPAASTTSSATETGHSDNGYAIISTLSY